MMGKQYRVLRDRGRFFPHALADAATVTVHPSSILRSPTPAQREESYQAFVGDLIAIRQKLVDLG
jgi:hypothetical protein